MTPDTVFSLCGALVLPCWLLLILLPRWSWTQRLATFVAPVLIAGVYLWMLATAPRVAGAGFNSIAQVRALFSVDRALWRGGSITWRSTCLSEAGRCGTREG